MYVVFQVSSKLEGELKRRLKGRKYRVHTYDLLSIVYVDTQGFGCGSGLLKILEDLNVYYYYEYPLEGDSRRVEVREDCECAICMESLCKRPYVSFRGNVYEYNQLLWCGHMFHASCIGKMLGCLAGESVDVSHVFAPDGYDESDVMCPLCRQESVGILWSFDEIQRKVFVNKSGLLILNESNVFESRTSVWNSVPHAFPFWWEVYSVN